MYRNHTTAEEPFNLPQALPSVAEFQKIHDEMSALRAAGKFEETAKFSTDDAVFVTPLHDKPYTKKDKIFLLDVYNRSFPEAQAIHEAAKSIATAKTTVKSLDVKVHGDIAIDTGTGSSLHDGKEVKST
ncbi:unnamed protein product [Enterobius vermicularis]|uniref:DUF4440 domain-containing protein n=1 Tax=Enterobius vermicularis TaxID=51028 RepID=A0A0N4VAV2_ENTVE|nr:unnamed protein product [Enterobius vermicularis]